MGRFEPTPQPSGAELQSKPCSDREDKQHPLSDEQLVKQLASHGITVARRTVTKYRKAMNIPSSRQRRDWSSATSETESDKP